MIKEMVVKAYVFSKEKHRGQKRKNSQLDYFVHPKAVARIVEELTGDEILVAAALLHDTLEDTATTYDELVKEFGYDVADTVLELSNSREERGDLTKREYLLRKMRDMDEDVLLIKLADRLNNVQYLDWDASTESAKMFLVYYAQNTKYIVDNLVQERKNNGRSIHDLREESCYLLSEIKKCLNRLNKKYGIFPENPLTTRE